MINKGILSCLTHLITFINRLSPLVTRVNKVSNLMKEMPERVGHFVIIDMTSLLCICHLRHFRLGRPSLKAECSKKLPQTISLCLTPTGIQSLEVVSQQVACDVGLNDGIHCALPFPPNIYYSVFATLT